MLPIRGLQKNSLIDYPGKIAATVFLGGCNFKCGFCYNINLVEDNDNLVALKEEEVLDFLKERKKWLDGVCITGGEPLLCAELGDFITKIKDIGLLVKLDTNGSKPDVLSDLIKRNLLDYIAMDIKCSKEKYKNVAGADADFGAVSRSIDIVKQSEVEHEFRSTIVPGIHDEDEIKLMAEMVGCGKRFALQQFRNLKTLDKKFQDVKPFSKEEMERFKKVLCDYFEEVELRGV